jgi:hypothetical protein
MPDAAISDKLSSLEFLDIKQKRYKKDRKRKRVIEREIDRSIEKRRFITFIFGYRTKHF